MKIMVFGIGGVGGFVGGALAHHYEETYFYARNLTKEIIARDGLRLDSVKLGNLVVKPKVVSDNPEELGPMDVIIMSCKGDKLEAACKAIAPLVKETTVVIPLLNGILVSDLMKQWLPPCILADGTIRIFSHIESPGHIVQDDGLCSISFGMQDGNNPPVFEEIAKILTAASVETKVVKDIVIQSWKKFMITGTQGAILCYFKGDTGFVRSQEGYKGIVEEAYSEVQQVAKARGVELSDEFVAKLVGTIDTNPAHTITSLYRDLLDGKDPRDTELDHLLGYLIKQGKELGIPTPVFEKAYNNFK